MLFQAQSQSSTLEQGWEHRELWHLLKTALPFPGLVGSFEIPEKYAFDLGSADNAC